MEIEALKLSNQGLGAAVTSEHPPPREAHWPEGAVFTVGHSTLPIERFIALLQTYGVKRLVDIRAIPRSRHNPQFNDTSLAESLTARGIEYAHIQSLGEACGAPTRFCRIPAGATKAFAAMPTICKARSFGTRLKRSFA